MNHIEDLTSLEAFGIAIKKEIEAQNGYKYLADMCVNDILRDRFLNLYNESKRNQTILEKQYKELFPDVELKIPKSTEGELKFSKAGKKMGIKDVLTIAINHQKATREFYLDMAETISDLSGKRVFRYLADMKFSHQMMLNAELEMVEKYPAYYNNPSSWDAESRLKAERIKRV